MQIFSLSFIFLVTNFYDYIGPAIWSVSLILIMIAMLHVKRTMLHAIAATITQFDPTLARVFVEKVLGADWDYDLIKLDPYIASEAT